MFWEARTEWKNIGIELNLLITDLNEITINGGGNVGNCFTEMLTLWLKQVDPPPTWSAMISALRQPTVGLQKLADSVSTESEPTKSDLVFEKKVLSFPHIKSVAPDERTRQLLEGRLREESLDIMQEFLVVINKFFDSLEKQDFPLTKLVEYLEGAVQDELSQLTSMRDVKTFIRNKSSFFDYRLVRYMITMAGTAENSEQLRKYDEAFLHYAKRRIYECPSKIKSCCANSTELQVKLDSQYDKCKLEELQCFQHRLTSILQISIYHCLLSKVEEGCFVVTFLVPKHISEDVFPLSSEQEKALMELKVLNIACGVYQKTFKRKLEPVN